MPDVYKRGIYLYINGQEVENNVKKITGEMRKLVNEQARMTIGSREYIEHSKKIAALKGVLTEHQAQLRQTSSSWLSLKKAADGFNRYFGLITSFVAGITGVVLGFRKAVDVSNQFEERLDNLSALTGLSGRELEWLGNTAKESSVKIMESGIRIKQSASDIVDAYTKMGSQRPELLKNKQALAAVTQDAIILSEAAKMELAPATAALATTMNQFNTAATESGRIINILAAGSKEGAAEIPYLTEALEKSGTTANMMGLSIEQTIGMIEAVAPKFAEARIAGTGFDRVLLNMRKNNIGYKDGVFDLNRALDELRARYKSGESAVDLFGVEHAKMAEVMLQAQGDYNKYTQAVTGTNVAIEQAAINTDNNNARLAQARNKLQLLTMELGEKLAPAMTFSTNSFSYLVKGLMAAPKWIQENKILLIALGGALLAYNGNLIKGIAIQAASTAIRLKDAAVTKVLVAQKGIEVAMTTAQATQTTALTFAQRAAVIWQHALNLVMKANPIGAVIAAVTALAAGIIYLTSHNQKAAAIEREKNSLITEAKQKTDALKETTQQLSKQIDNLNTLSIQEKKDLQDKIDKTIELNRLELEQLTNRKEKLFAQASELNGWQKFWRSRAKEQELAMKKGEKATKEITEEMNNLGDATGELVARQKELNDVMNSEALGDALKTETVADMEAKMQRYQTALKNVAVNGEDYRRILEKISVLNAKLAKSKDIDISTGKITDQNIAIENGRRLMALYGSQYSDLLEQIKSDTKNQDALLADLLQEELDKLMTSENPFGPTILDRQNMADWQYLLESSFEGQRELERQKYADGLIGRKQYEDNLRKIDADSKAAQIDSVESWASAVNGLVGAVGTFYEAQKNRELKAAGNNAKKKEEIERKFAKKQQQFAITQTIIDGIIEVAKIWKSAAEYGPAGVAIGALLTGVAVARTAASIALISSQQYAKGKYPVVGADDGRTYQSSFIGPVRTGLYQRPTLGLFSEKEPEIVIDGPTTRNIRANYPGILSAIQSARVSQHASGKYPVVGELPNNSVGINSELTAALNHNNAIMERLVHRLDKGINAPIVYSDLERADREITQIRSSVTMT